MTEPRGFKLPLGFAYVIFTAMPVIITIVNSVSPPNDSMGLCLVSVLSTVATLKHVPGD